MEQTVVPAQCQVMKANSMQCQNIGFATFAKIPYCLLHLNAKMNEQIEAKTIVTADQFELLDPTTENKVLLERAINFTNDSVTSANAT